MEIIRKATTNKKYNMRAVSFYANGRRIVELSATVSRGFNGNSFHPYITMQWGESLSFYGTTGTTKEYWEMLRAVGLKDFNLVSIHHMSWSVRRPQANDSVRSYFKDALAELEIKVHSLTDEQIEKITIN